MSDRDTAQLARRLFDAAAARFAANIAANPQPTTEREMDADEEMGDLTRGDWQVDPAELGERHAAHVAAERTDE